MDRRPQNAPELKAFMDAIEAYKDKELDVPDDEAEGGAKCVVVEYFWGERVRLRDATSGEAGRVVLIEAGPCGVRYEVSWPDSREVSIHHGFELEAAE